MGLCLFPFLMRPVLQKMANMKDKAFVDLMLERKELIPAWFKAMLKSK
jgi:hypothetical protein